MTFANFMVVYIKINNLSSRCKQQVNILSHCGKIVLRPTLFIVVNNILFINNIVRLAMWAS
jgi:hypothetical protein